MRTYVRMRWDEQRVENDLRLPGVGDGTVVRTFDAPEAMGINFHEVRARSALNHVPGGRYGFGWTINPYRGCTHACVFCLSGTPRSSWPTAVQAFGGSSEWATRSTALFAVGPTAAMRSPEVLAHWMTRKPAYRITLGGWDRADRQRRPSFSHGAGMEVRHGRGARRARRPHLTLNNKLMGMGALGASRGRVGRVSTWVSLRVDSRRRPRRLVLV